ncbi:putative 2-dehydropantoate 2-reductase [Oscillatoria sp. HE19RPO]|uniref:putative 2-dehydropantoate 2-reductase n=1 Tax=Oscillatoria sp. HE19RPO TaxID=2954806 RepID=UPI0020C58CC9|nr:putative 2-dehydropantoate 2-reductase [Oscillatoria sp. HE19RPO]
MGTALQSQRNRSYAIIGTGAIGGFYGAKLQQAGFEVHFLLHSDYQFVRQRGLRVDSVWGDFTLNSLNVYNDVHQMPPCDVVIVALKTTRNSLLTNLLPPVLKESGAVLMLQNGLGNEEAVAPIVGPAHILGGLCFICSNKVGEGHIHHLDYGTITLGEYAPDYQPLGITATLRNIAGDFETAGIPIQFAEDLLLARWKKLIWNIPYNGLSVVLNARTDEIMENESTRLLSEQLMREVVAVAAAYGREIPESFIQKMLDHTAKMKPYITSMKLDYDQHRPLEVESIVGNPLQAAIAKQIPVLKIAMLYAQLNFINTQIQATPRLPRS